MLQYAVLNHKIHDMPSELTGTGFTDTTTRILCMQNGGSVLECNLLFWPD